MQISNFESVRVGSGFPASFDIRNIDGHESYGVYASIFTHKVPGEQSYFQLREHALEGNVALFAFKFNTLKLPAGWENSSVIWDSRASKDMD